MRAVKDLSALKRELETAQVRLASLMGFHPSTEFKLVGKEYGNFELPEIKSSLDEMEWIALTNRPELRVRDMVTNVDEVKSSFRVFTNPGQAKYKNDPNYYNRMWAKKARQIGMNVLKMSAIPRKRARNLAPSADDDVGVEPGLRGLGSLYVGS